METYKLNELLENAINRNDLYLVRGALVGILQTDISLHLNEIDHAIRYAESKGIHVFEDLDSKYRINESKTQWDKAYLAYTLTYLHENFSKERLEHTKAVANYLHNHTAANERSTSTMKDERRTSHVRQKAEGDERINVPTTNNNLLMLIGGVGILALIIYLISR